ncbi:fluoride efflux transporter CrcB [Yersinia massiliensis]|jgi:CrcB protein|uniref:Fluoride-specific ion channel FluC n=3 Tax=Yersinia TaxID=629 RepID=A0A0T9QM31_9GAMM|nr:MULTISPECIES: fluoride efflux transporter CrcB [Yersinia]HEC1650337.1 fluoride efflux transporter CrcB [Yersinia enterocolitica]ATM87090.1 fluoride efflux transporter CrcB [Yersinia frederiksenii]AVX37110.1 fluoride efflux transporter CrcB [Yersinia massiliensis]MCB5308859.1 fluoride efflux transporter CrcB [Yersinia massiliensis]MCB5319870.1 fluoride efflux transporter CrcB [Yersinia massiliensis]
MPNLIILVFVGGAFGAMCREFIMLSVPRLADGFPMDIFVANIIAAFLLGLATSLFKKDIINQYVHLMVGTGIMGGLSTFSSFVFGAVEMMKNPTGVLVSICYLVISLIVGFIAVELGLMVGPKEKPKDPQAAVE